MINKLGKAIKTFLFGEEDKQPIKVDKSNIHVMIDIETMGKSKRAPVVSIGAVVFNPNTKELGKEFFKIVDLTDSAKYGVIDPDTVIWWLEQAQNMKPEFLSDDKVPLAEALFDLDSWLKSLGPKWRIHIWGNGADFDNVILENAYQTLGIKVPWNHWNNEHVRTMVTLGKEILEIDPKKSLKFEGTAHNALADAKHQARYVSEIWSYVGFLKKQNTEHKQIPEHDISKVVQTVKSREVKINHPLENKHYPSTTTSDLFEDAR